MIIKNLKIPNFFGLIIKIDKYVLKMELKSYIPNFSLFFFKFFSLNSEGASPVTDLNWCLKSALSLIPKDFPIFEAGVSGVEISISLASSILNSFLQERNRLPKAWEQ